MENNLLQGVFLIGISPQTPEVYRVKVSEKGNQMQYIIFGKYFSGRLLLPQLAGNYDPTDRELRLYAGEIRYNQFWVNSS